MSWSARRAKAALTMQRGEASDDSVLVDLGVSTADARDVRFDVDGTRIVVRFVDWKDVERELALADPLAVRWVVARAAQAFRDDATCEVRGSAWLAATARELGVTSDGYAHYQLGFNEPGMVLEVIARRR